MKKASGFEVQTPFSKLKNKSNKIKDWYGLDFVKIFCEQINKNTKSFDEKLFLKLFKKDYGDLELKQRLKLISQLLNELLSGSYQSQLKVLKGLLGKEWPYEEGMMNYGFYLYPVAQFVEDHAVSDVEESLKFIKELTKRFTGEWAIRPIANAKPSLCLNTLKAWSKDENFHVRRLASEGLRAKLPWGMKIDWVNEKPEKTISIYSRLRNDKVLYVRRSVANSMGDMIKINEDLAYATFLSWLEKKKTKENIWVIKHAIRHPVKHKKLKFLELKKELLSLEKET